MCICAWLWVHVSIVCVWPKPACSQQRCQPMQCQGQPKGTPRSTVHRPREKKNVSIKCIDHRQTVTHSDAWILTGYNSSLEGTCLFLLRSQHCGAHDCCHDLELLCGFTSPVCFRGWAWFSWRAGAPVLHTRNTSNQQLQLKYSCSARLLLPLTPPRRSLVSVRQPLCLCSSPDFTSILRHLSSVDYLWALSTQDTQPPLTPVTSLNYALDLRCPPPHTHRRLLSHHRWVELRYCTS